MQRPHDTNEPTYYDTDFSNATTSEMLVNPFVGKNLPKPSKWKCYLFGGTDFYGLMWRPAEGQEPNAFWRWMQYICFGNRWEKDK